MSDNIYSKSEISKILKTASEIQTRKDLYGNKDGLDEHELIELAKEVGIDRESLLEALDKHNQPEFNTSYSWLKATSRVQQVEMVQGEINEENWEEVVQEIRRINGGIGKLIKNGSSFEWEQRMQEIGYKHLSFSPQNGKTKIQAVFSWSPLRLLTLFLSFFFGGLAVIVFLKGLGYPKELGVLFSPFGAVAGISVASLYLRSKFVTEKKKIGAIIRSVGKVLSGKQQPSIEIDSGLEYSEETVNRSINKESESI